MTMEKTFVIDSFPESALQYREGWAVVAVDVIRATTMAITAAASDNVGVSSVTISAGGTTICTVTVAPYSCSWNTATVANGTYTISVTAKDVANNSATATTTVLP